MPWAELNSAGRSLSPCLEMSLKNIDIVLASWMDDPVPAGWLRVFSLQVFFFLGKEREREKRVSWCRERTISHSAFQLVVGHLESCALLSNPFTIQMKWKEKGMEWNGREEREGVEKRRDLLEEIETGECYMVGWCRRIDVPISRSPRSPFFFYFLFLIFVLLLLNLWYRAWDELVAIVFILLFSCSVGRVTVLPARRGAARHALAFLIWCCCPGTLIRNYNKSTL